MQHLASNVAQFCCHPTVMTLSTSIPMTMPMLMLYLGFHLSSSVMQALRAQFFMLQPSKSHDTPSRPLGLLEIQLMTKLSQWCWLSHRMECHDPDLKPYYIQRHQLSTEQSCLIWGLRVIIPPNLREPILKELHWSHPGVARMKSMAQSHVWWPK